jgi:dipeptidyl aminopeptidase/acylaminoacyl peptidase
MGYPVGKHYDEQSNITNAAKLQGHLFLIVGEADTNVPPESTYRFTDALIKAGKTYDFLMVPGMGHGDGGIYGRKKKRDYFVKYLLGVDPPDRNMKEI